MIRNGLLWCDRTIEESRQLGLCRPHPMNTDRIFALLCRVTILLPVSITDPRGRAHCYRGRR